MLERSGVPFCLDQDQQPQDPVMPSEFALLASKNNVQSPVRMN